MEPIVLIVVGSTLASELADRPPAYLLRDAILAWLRDHGIDDLTAACVCGDLWYMCQDDLRRLPVVAIGGPETNALAANLADRLPSVLTIDDVLMVQADPEFAEAVASCWGVDGEATARATTAFIDRYLDAFMLAAARDRLAAD